MKMTQIWMLVLLFCCGWVYSAPDQAQSLHMTVPYGQTVILPCDGSAFEGEEDPEVSWEAMGSDVLAITGEEVTVHKRYEGRVSVSDLSGADWSLVLDSVRLSDRDMYECIWRGRRTLSTVWLTVEYPEVDSVLEVYTHNTVTLPCYLDLPRNLPPEDLNVWWEKDGAVLMERSKNQIDFYMDDRLTPREPERFLHPQNIDKFPLIFTQHMSFVDPGEYTCWYRTKESEDERPGIPGTINVILKGTFDIEELENTENSTEEGGSALFWTTPFERSEETTTNEIPVLLDTVTLPMEVSTESLPMEAYDETATAFPDEVNSEFLPVEADEETATTSPDEVSSEFLPVEANEETAAVPEGDPHDDSEETIDWSDFPWVRIGLIAGVLLVTALALCILGLLHKL